MTLTDPIALRTLVPPSDARDTVPAGFSTLVSDLSGGLPAVLPLTARLSIALVLPTGSMRAWADADPEALIAADTLPSTGRTADASAYALRLVLVADRRPIAAAPLVRGQVRLLPDDSGSPAEIALVALSWRVTAAAAFGPGAQGCRLHLAWRPVGPAANVPDTPLPRPGEPLAPGTGSGYAGPTHSPSVPGRQEAL